jgi:hypothetical protein
MWSIVLHLIFCLYPPDDEKAMEFADYILNTYVDDNAKFYSRIWGDPNLDTRRTKNGCENFHRQLGTMFYHSHPNIFDFESSFFPHGIATRETRLD